MVQVKEWLYKHILRIIKKYDKVTFITGGALGVDTWAFEAVAKARLMYNNTENIQNVMILPCVEHYIKWPESTQHRMKQMINHIATDVFYSDANRYTGPAQMYKRNVAMVNASDGVIAVWDESPGGTANCIEYAVKKGVPIVGYNPNRKKQFTM